jgi:hypothetical protein
MTWPQILAQFALAFCSAAPLRRFPLTAKKR